jgi:hypothetical protein
VLGEVVVVFEYGESIIVVSDAPRKKKLFKSKMLFSFLVANCK